MIEKIKFYYVGSSKGKESITSGKKGKEKIEYPLFIPVLYHQTKGRFIIDTGYGSSAFLEKLRFPENLLYGKGIYNSSHGYQEFQNNVNEEDTILISHFHPDHIGGAKELTAKKYIVPNVLEKLESLSLLNQKRQGFFEYLFPKDIKLSYIETCDKVPSNYLELSDTIMYDILGDESILAFAIPGHAIGQYGFLLKTKVGIICYATDASWHLSSIKMKQYPSKITGLFCDNYNSMINTINNLSAFIDKYDDIPIVLTHCLESHQGLYEWSKIKKRSDLIEYKNCATVYSNIFAR